MSQNYWISKEKLDNYRFFAVESKNEAGKLCIRQAGSGPFLSLSGAQRGLKLIQSKPQYSDARIIEFIGDWQEVK